MNKPTILAASFLLASTAFAAQAALQPAGATPARQSFRQQIARRVAARLEARMHITPTQREQAKSILASEKPTILALAQRARQEREELSGLSSFNESQVRDIAGKCAATNTEILVERTKVRLELRAILDDAQRRQLDTLRSRAGTNLSEHLDTLGDAI